jgi:hypothetical protein
VSGGVDMRAGGSSVVRRLEARMGLDDRSWITDVNE